MKKRKTKKASMMTAEDFGKFVNRHGGFMKQGKLHPDVPRDFDPDDGWEDIREGVEIELYYADQCDDGSYVQKNEPCTHSPFKGKFA